VGPHSSELAVTALRAILSGSPRTSAGESVYALLLEFGPGVGTLKEAAMRTPAAHAMVNDMITNHYATGRPPAWLRRWRPTRSCQLGTPPWAREAVLAVLLVVGRSSSSQHHQGASYAGLAPASPPPAAAAGSRTLPARSALDRFASEAPPAGADGTRPGKLLDLAPESEKSTPWLPTCVWYHVLGRLRPTDFGSWQRQYGHQQHCCPR